MARLSKKRQNEAMGLFENARRGLEIAYGIMTQNKEGEENDHNA